MGDVKKDAKTAKTETVLTSGTRAKIAPIVTKNPVVSSEATKHKTGDVVKSHLGVLEVLGTKSDGFVLVATEENGASVFFTIHKDALKED